MRTMHRALGSLLVIVGVGGVGGGIGLLSDPSGAALGLSPDALAGSPFGDYLVPACSCSWSTAWPA